MPQKESKGTHSSANDPFWEAVSFVGIQRLKAVLGTGPVLVPTWDCSGGAGEERGSESGGVRGEIPGPPVFDGGAAAESRYHCR